MDLLAGAYASSSSGDDGENGGEDHASKSPEIRLPKKRKRKRGRKRKKTSGSKPSLPLPSQVSEMFRDDEDNPEEHQGRKRSFKHVVGNWPLHVYIPVEKKGFVNEFTSKIATKIQKEISKHKMAPKLIESKELHISLSRPLALRRHQIYPFIHDLRKRVLLLQKKPLPITLKDVYLYENNEKTRVFYSLDTTIGTSEILELIQATDEAVSIFDLQTYYENPRPHMTLAWHLTPNSNSTNTPTPNPNSNSNSNPFPKPDLTELDGEEGEGCGESRRKEKERGGGGPARVFETEGMEILGDRIECAIGDKRFSIVFDALQS
ncbi:hypothetical protein AAMO2058_001287800 [Amorphochlora amoebiformis]